MTSSCRFAYASEPMRWISENTSEFTSNVAGWPQMETLTQVPPGRVLATAAARTASTPAHSKVTSAPRPSVSSRMASGTSTSVGSRTWSAPAPGAFAFRASAGSTTMTWPAPVARSAVLTTSDDGLVSTHLWDCTAGRFHWYFGVDEVVHILEGEVHVTGDDGRTVILRTGDIGHFALHSHTIWHVPEYVRKFAVHRAPRPVPLPVRAARKLRRLAA